MIIDYFECIVDDIDHETLYLYVTDLKNPEKREIWEMAISEYKLLSGKDDVSDLAKGSFFIFSSISSIISHEEEWTEEQIKDIEKRSLELYNSMRKT